MTTFDDVTSATAPAAGHAQFGPADTYRALSGIVPTMTSNGTSNALDFHYGTYHDPGQDTTTVDLLYTVTAGGQPFADGLFLTDQANESEGSTNDGSSTANALSQVQLTEPVLTITKGIVSFDDTHAVVTPNPYGFSAPGSAGYRGSGTINSNALTSSPIIGTVTSFDAGNLVTFAVVVQNTGSGLNGAFDVTLKDTLPAGFVVPAGPNCAWPTARAPRSQSRTSAAGRGCSARGSWSRTATPRSAPSPPTARRAARTSWS